MSDIVERLRDVPDSKLSAYAADEIERLEERLAEAEALLLEARENIEHWGSYAGDYFRDKWNLQGDLDKIDAFLRPADSASAVQPERCCLDYPRCDCNSPPEPDDDWLCFQRPAQPKVTP